MMYKGHIEFRCMLLLEWGSTHSDRCKEGGGVTSPQRLEYERGKKQDGIDSLDSPHASQSLDT